MRPDRTKVARNRRVEGSKAMEDRNNLLKAIAEGLDSWAIVEAHLCSIFAVAVTAKEYPAAAAAFSAIVSFDAQINMVHASMTRTFPNEGEIYLEWKALKKKLDGLRSARNKLAHGKVVPVTMKGGETSWRYLPFFHFFTHKERDEFIHLKTTDIEAINVDFRKIVSALSNFGKKIDARQEIKTGKILSR
jgi:hypothetical protein